MDDVKRREWRKVNLQPSQVQMDIYIHGPGIDTFEPFYLVPYILFL